ncbi:PhzF family phenazine biosynthesis protein [Pseudohalocynthiibacter aestuariivivens]|uniref:PhzF family phenazine biosynthesis protein n=1 Tax=Roseovarius pelagicus TaxID=2980108 RepID=A0ABY6DHL1_9RHOB|nr:MULTISPECIES: PhzF family phenazine biosynthesis protein [Rhodobacterales]QIE46724.1 PhzF family phenazine biosynthesis protein [Pseudohalocynthiibacter aestuariivivens]UXX84738.1 PhzF family phenazine biosynthesis protein [Roseovarius pelagicus]
MTVQKIASFTLDGAGGNPAGVLIAAVLPPDDEMQRIAAEVGFSETAFAAPQGDGFRVRYFAPEAEVPFCGHATIALGAALGAAYGAGAYDLTLNEAMISVLAYEDAGAWGARLTSPPTSYRAVSDQTLAAFCTLFGLKIGDLAPDLPPVLANGGAEHLILPLAHAALLQDMAYDFDAGAALMQQHGLVTVDLIWRERADLIHARNAFAGHGVYEDPATGAAAAALAGYLRDSGVHADLFEVIQGVGMGMPSRLHVAACAGSGAPVEVAGLTRLLG